MAINLENLNENVEICQLHLCRAWPTFGSAQPSGLSIHFEYEQDSALMAGISDYYWPGVFVYTTGIGLMLIFWHRKKHSRNGVVVP